VQEGGHKELRSSVCTLDGGMQDLVKNKLTAVQDVTSQTPTINCSKDSKHIAQNMSDRMKKHKKYG
jgi:hypothetical protein